MLGNLLRVPRPHLPHRAAYSILPVGALKEVGGLPFLTSRQPNDAPKPPSTGATCVSELGRPSLSLSLSLALPHPPASMHRESGSNCFLAYHFLCFLFLILSASHCLCFFSTLSHCSPRFPYEFGSFPLSSVNGRAEFRTDPCSLQRNNKNGVAGDGLVD